jgi:hypothetical protein
MLLSCGLEREHQSKGLLLHCAHLQVVAAWPECTAAMIKGARANVARFGERLGPHVSLKMPWRPKDVA